MKRSRLFNLNPIATAIAIVIAATPVLAANTSDTDRDGLTHDQEITLLTDPFNVDTDGGGAHDGWEVQNGFDPLDPSDDANIQPDLDIDNDGIGNPEEGADAFDTDSDEDGLTDTFEAGLPDADGDGFIDDLTDINNNGMPDIAETLAVSGAYPDFDSDGAPDYLDEDSDNDGVPDNREYSWRGMGSNFIADPMDIDGDGFLNGHDLDADGDGKLDADEYNNSLTYEQNDIDGDGISNHLDADDSRAYLPPDNGIDSSSNDMDHDGLTNDEEALYGTDPRRADTDGGGVTDIYEIKRGFDPIDASDDMVPDANLDTNSNDMDRDGLTNDEEELYGTDPRRADTDGGGVFDDWEIARGFNPNYAADDITISPDIDFDNDGVLNEFEGSNKRDADSDGDGASDALEIGLIDADNNGRLDNLTDVNANGMPDVAEAIAASLAYPDFDGDGIPNHLDIDSDNDGVHDKLEYDTSWVPEGYVGNPLDVDGDGQLNGLDYDSDGDGTPDFDEQRVSSKSQVRNAKTHMYDYRSPTINGVGQVHELADDDGDGIPNQADALDAGSDSDGDGIANYADIDRARVWNRQDDCLLYYCYKVPTYDNDGDGIENDFDWDSNNDGALDLTANDSLYDTADNDGIPALFDADDQTAYTPEAVVIPETEVELTPVEKPDMTNVASNETPETGAAGSIETSGGGGAFGFWTLFALCFASTKRFKRLRK